MPSQFFIKTFGCQMNVADTERMGALLAEAGMRPAEDPAEADLILINGCSVREKAVHKAVSQLGEYGKMKRTASSEKNGAAGGEESSVSTKPEKALQESLSEVPSLETEEEDSLEAQAAKDWVRAIQGLEGRAGKKPLIGVGGCVGQLEKKKLFRKAPYLDFVFGTDSIDQLPELIYRVEKGERQLVAAEFDPTMSYSTQTKVMGHKAQAYVNIMKGCDKYCTYCIVPFTRGREKSRTIDEVVEDVVALVEKGVREITLLGQNVNSFGKGNKNEKQRLPIELHSPIGKVGPRAGEENFPQLLRALDTDPRLQALKRIRFTSSHPLDFSDELVDCYATAERGGVAKLAPHLHLPVQSGSDRILEKMGRHHKIETYIEQMLRLKSLNPEVGLSTDLIVGFPTETEEDFQATLRLLDQIEFDNIYAFAYSPRPGTRAAKLEDDVPLKEKNRRLNLLLDYQLEIAERRYQQRVGRVLEVLVEGQAKNQSMLEEHPGQPDTSNTVWTGRTGCNRVVNFVSKVPRKLTGQFVHAKITRATSLSLHGELTTDAWASQ